MQHSGFIWVTSEEGAPDSRVRKLWAGCPFTNNSRLRQRDDAGSARPLGHAASVSYLVGLVKVHKALAIFLLRSWGLEDPHSVFRLIQSFEAGILVSIALCSCFMKVWNILQILAFSYRNDEFQNGKSTEVKSEKYEKN